VVQPRVGGHLGQAVRRPRLRIERTDHQPLQPRIHKRPRAHEAGLERDVERAVGEPPSPEGPGARLQRAYLGVGDGVAVGLAPVVGRRDHLPLPNEHRPHGDVAGCCGLGRLGHGQLHEPRVVGTHLGWRGCLTAGGRPRRRPAEPDQLARLAVGERRL
jgi:hypothetical protein